MVHTNICDYYGKIEIYDEDLFIRMVRVVTPSLIVVIENSFVTGDEEL